MYPTIYHAVKDLFGLDLPGLKLLQSFGFFVAIAFLLAAVFLAKEIRRREKLGQFTPSTRRVKIGVPATAQELITQFFFGFIIGWKIVGLLIDEGATADPRAYVLSTEGNLIAGMLLGIVFAGWRWYSANKKKLPEPKEIEEKVSAADHVGNITLMAALGGIIGAKLFHILENLKQLGGERLERTGQTFGEAFSEMLFSFSGLTMYGGLIVGGLAVLWYARRHKMPLLHVMDAAAPSLMLAYGVGRIGCQVSGDGDWGVVNTSPAPSFLPQWAWGYTYPNNVNEEGVPIPGCEGDHCTQLPEPVWPTPLYEAVTCILFFFILWAIRKRVTAPGQLFSIYLIMNGVERFCIELIRVNEEMFRIGSFKVTQAEFIAVILVLLGCTGLWWTRKRRKEKLQGT